jgi:SAM-dependent methyltransferase
MYSILGFFTTRGGEETSGRKILDCGAGGDRPPLALFAPYGFDLLGIDISEDRLGRARAFCEEESIAADLLLSDMRDLPFPDETFDFVYEYSSMCHMKKSGIAQTVGEMRRVLKAGGYCSLGFILDDTWPPLGRERERGSGEYWRTDEDEEIIHSAFSAPEAEAYLAGLDVVQKTYWTTVDAEKLAKTSWEEWLKYWDLGDAPEAVKRDNYDRRVQLARYSHLVYFLNKPRP